MVKDWKLFLLRQEQEKDAHLLQFLEEVKWSLFTDGMIMYVENPKDYT